MKRTAAILWSGLAVVMALAIAVGPASAKPDYGAPSSTVSDQDPFGVTDHTSLNAMLGESPAVPTSVVQTAYRSPSSIVDTEESVPRREPTVVRASSGFDWEDALVGAVGALGLALIAFIAAEMLRRHHRVSVSRA